MTDAPMGAITQTVDNFLQVIIRLGQAMALAIVTAEAWVREQLGILGIEPHLQTIILVILAMLMVLTAVRLAGGIIRVAMLALLLLVLLDLLLPVLRAASA